MTLEATRNRLTLLAAFDGEIGLEGDLGTEEIVIRLDFNNRPEAAEAAYNLLLDIEDDRCADCGRYEATDLKAGLCSRCYK